MVEPYDIHCIVYGDSGAKKSTLFATFPKPMVVFAFDPPGKCRPYLRRGDHVSAMKEDDEGTPFQLVKKGGNLLIRIEYYLDPNPRDPTAYRRFAKRMAGFDDEYDAWRTAILDSVTFLERAARYNDKFRVNKGSKEPRQHYAASAEAIEEMIGARFASLPMNVGVVCHVNQDKDDLHGNMVYSIAAPGQQAKKTPAGFDELYHLYVELDDKDQPEWRVQTTNDGIFYAATQIPAPNGCRPVYKALWEGEA